MSPHGFYKELEYKNPSCENVYASFCPPDWVQTSGTGSGFLSLYEEEMSVDIYLFFCGTSVKMSSDYISVLQARGVACCKPKGETLWTDGMSSHVPQCFSVNLCLEWNLEYASLNMSLLRLLIQTLLTLVFDLHFSVLFFFVLGGDDGAQIRRLLASFIRYSLIIYINKLV